MTEPINKIIHAIKIATIMEFVFKIDAIVILDGLVHHAKWILTSEEILLIILIGVFNQIMFVIKIAIIMDYV